MSEMTTKKAVCERPIPFNGSMVRAIMNGAKTQTRRVLAFPRAIREVEGGEVLTAFDRLQPGYADGSTRAVFDFDEEPNSFAVRCPYGKTGDRLWVREELRPWDEAPYLGAKYAADGKVVRLVSKGGHMETEAAWPRDARYKVVPPMFMPRAFSRLTLEITGVRVERVQEISRDDAIAEGISVLPLQDADDPSAWWQSAPGVHQARTPQASYRTLWDSLNASRGYGWDANPWVWVVEFRTVNV